MPPSGVTGQLRLGHLGPTYGSLFTVEPLGQEASVYILDGRNEGIGYLKLRADHGGKRLAVRR